MCSYFLFFVTTYQLSWAFVRDHRPAWLSRYYLGFTLRELLQAHNQNKQTLDLLLLRGSELMLSLGLFGNPQFCSNRCETLAVGSKWMLLRTFKVWLRLMVSKTVCQGSNGILLMILSLETLIILNFFRAFSKLISGKHPL